MSPISKSAEQVLPDGQRAGKPAIQQTWQSALQAPTAWRTVPPTENIEEPKKLPSAWPGHKWAARSRLFLLLLCAPSAAAQIEETNLPPVAAVTIDFTRDIKPILNNSCLRCHTGQKPRSGFRLENRAEHQHDGV